MKKGFQSDLHAICSTDALRPAMNHVYMKDGYVYATNGTVAIKQHLSLHDFTPDEIAMMHNKFIYRDRFKAMLKGEFMYTKEDGINVIDKNGSSTFFPWNYTDPYPNVDSVINNWSQYDSQNIDHIALSPSQLLLLYKAMPMDFDGGIRLGFCGLTKAIIVEPVGLSSKQIALIMPVQMNTWTESRGLQHPMLKNTKD